MQIGFLLRGNPRRLKHEYSHVVFGSFSDIIDSLGCYIFVWKDKGADGL